MATIVPTKEAMLLCDSVITEVGTNKKSLIGVFENINIPKFPCRYYKLSVYVKFTSAQGRYNFRLELVDLQNGEIIGKGITPELNIIDKLGSYELAFNLLGLEFKHPGKYDFRVYVSDRMFANKTFNVIEVRRLDVGN